MPSTYAAFSVQASSASRTDPAVAAHGEADDHRHRGDRRRAGVEVGAEHADRARVGERAGRARRARRRGTPRRAAARRRISLAASGAEVVGVQAGEVVDRARAGGERDRHRAVRRELLDVRAQRQPARGGDRAQALEVLVGERDRLDVDVERVDVGRVGASALDLVHPRVGGEARRARRGRTGRSTAVVWATSLAERAAEARRRAARRRPTARSRSCPRTSSCRCASISAARPRACARTSSSSARRERARRRRDPAAARARSPRTGRP